MKKQTENFTTEEELRNDTEILKLKLEVEKGAVIHMPEGPQLPAEIENAWFNHIYNYERLCKEAGYTTVYEMIGSPEFRRLSEIPAEEVRKTLEQLLEQMDSKGVKLTYEEDCYPSATLYTFVTEELFQHEVCRYRGPEGDGHTVFCYEEFHPNHNSDLHRYTMEFIYQIFDDKNWNPKFLQYTHEKQIILNGKELSLEEYSNCILKFKDKFPYFLFSEPKIDEIIFDLDTSKGKVSGTVEMLNEPVPYVLHFYLSYGMWAVSGLEMELVSNQLK